MIATLHSYATEPGILARDDYDQYTAADLEAYLRVKHIPNADAILNSISAKTPTKKDIISDLFREIAFQNLFVRERIQNRVIPDVIKYKVREISRDYAYNRRMAEIQTECQITTPELLQAYKANREKYKIDERRKIAVLYKVFPKDPELRKRLPLTLEHLRARADFNKNFLQYVKRYSDLPGAINGGIVDYFTRGTYGPTVEKFAG